MAETVHPRGGAPVTLRPCPPWCSRREHFSDDLAIDTDDGYHHYGPEIAIPTSDRMALNDPETVVKVSLKAWTPELDANPGPARIELQLGTARGSMNGGSTVRPRTSVGSGKYPTSTSPSRTMSAWCIHLEEITFTDTSR